MNPDLLTLSLVVFALLVGLVVVWRVFWRKHGRPRPASNTAVSGLVRAVISGGDFTENDLYTALAKAGIPDGDADRAIKFTQIAWGRQLLAQLGLSKFSTGYWCLSAAGDVIETGSLSDQPHYIAAVKATKAHVGSAGFQRFALMSSELGVVHNALKAGSKLENIEISPPALFMETPTAAGLEKCKRLVTEWLRSRRSAVTARLVSSGEGSAEDVTAGRDSGGRSME